MPITPKGGDLASAISYATSQLPGNELVGYYNTEGKRLPSNATQEEIENRHGFNSEDHRSLPVYCGWSGYWRQFLAGAFFARIRRRFGAYILRRWTRLTDTPEPKPRGRKPTAQDITRINI